MAKFAQEVKTVKSTKKVAGKKVVNHQGGVGYQVGAEKELATFLLTSFMNGGFYETQAAQVDRLTSLVGQVDPVFAAKAAIYARDVFGMRSVTHVVGAELTRQFKGQPWMKGAIGKLIVRPDDAVEMVAFAKAKGPVPNSLKKGVILGLQKFDGYQLAKWNRGSGFNLVDAINLVTGGATGKYRANVISPQANELVKGTLAIPETWETALSAAGQSDEDVNVAKADAWHGIVTGKKIGQMALLKNLRNILQATNSMNSEMANEMVEVAASLLSDENRVAKSRIFPFRYITALTEIQNANAVSAAHLRVIRNALNKALDISVLANVPTFEGKTLIAVDDSGSMSSQIGGDRSVHRTASQVAVQLAAIMYKKNPDNTRVLSFENTAKWMTLPNPEDTTTTVVEKLQSQVRSGGGTIFGSIFKLIGSEKFDRIIVISDMQGMDWELKNPFGNYKNRFNPEVFIHSMNMMGYGTSMFAPTEKVATYGGFSEKVFDIMSRAESDSSALVTEINNVQL